MTNMFDDFLGVKFCKFDSQFYKVSIVNYETPVSEEWHRHENFHLSAVLMGGNLESRKKRDLQVNTGKLLLYNQGELHRNRFTHFPSKNLNIEVKDAFFKDYNFEPDSLSLEHSNYIDNYFNVIKTYRELIIDDCYTNDSIHSLLQSFFTNEIEDRIPPSWLKNVREIVNDRWDEFISLDELAYELNVHPVTISKYFRRHYNCTLADYMRKIKIQKAVYLLLHSNRTITEIAMDCGFSDHSHMTRLFKFYLGFNPKEIAKL